MRLNLGRQEKHNREMSGKVVECIFLSERKSYTEREREREREREKLCSINFPNFQMGFYFVVRCNKAYVKFLFSLNRDFDTV